VRAQPLREERVEFEPQAFSDRYIYQMILLAFLTVVIQVGFLFLSLADTWSPVCSLVPAPRGPVGFSASTMVFPGSAAICKGQLWVSVGAGSPAVGRLPASRSASSRLHVFDLKSGKSRDTNIKLSPSPVGLLVIDDQLWAVSENIMYRIQGDQAVPRHPRRVLIQPSRPFTYEGRLAVIDKDRNDVFTLLMWGEGEWVERGKIDLPMLNPSSPWLVPEVRVLSRGSSQYLFFFDGQGIRLFEGIMVRSSADPVSALVPENRSQAGPSSRGPAPDWQQATLPVAAGSTWEAMMVDDELWVYHTPPSLALSQVSICKYLNGNWIHEEPNDAVNVLSIAIAAGEQSFLVTDDLRLFTVDGSSLRRVTSGIQASERLRYIFSILDLLARYLAATGFLVLGAWWLMRVHRRPQYVFGKRNAILASVLRRGIARGIDVVLSMSPALFWLLVATDAEERILPQSVFTGARHPYLIPLIWVISIQMGITVVLSIVEGVWGMTPGKLVCGIRALRTTLRPCGVLRALAREMLVYIDGALLVTWLPGVLLIGFTPYWQRLGDLTADTVVVLDPKRHGDIPGITPGIADAASSRPGTSGIGLLMESFRGIR
jgi:uncharacterized RDD family membrane protein YckC